MASAEDNSLLVAAIDFGTTFSGYAFSFTSSKKNPKIHEQIRTNKSWGAALGFQSYKTPTSVLITKDGRFVDFGFDAEQKYSQSLQSDDSDSSDDENDETPDSDLLLFRHFKMMLHNQKNVRTKAAISAVDGTIRPALDIFAHALEYLKNHMLTAIKLETGSLPATENIKWVITVPAIWSETSKKFMREALHKAGCIVTKDSRKLIIALEPEAASLCCRRLNLANYADEKGISFPTGTQYLVLDCGGGTIDITAHVMEFDQKVKEILSASGGPWGGTKVDQNFIRLMERALGADFLNKYREKHPQEWLQFLTNFEKMKKGLKPDGESKICISMPWSMGNFYPSLNRGKKIERAFKSAEGLSFSSGMITIKHEAVKGLFQPVIEQIISHVKELMQSPNMSGLRYILMVGGFSECLLLQKAVKEAFEKNGVKVLIPSEAQLAIIKGAVIFGHTPSEIKGRISRCSYGCAVDPDFDSSIHDISRRYVNKEGKAKASDVIEVLVNKDEAIENGIVKTTDLNKPVGSTKVKFCIYAMDFNPSTVIYDDDPRVTHMGTVFLPNLVKAKKTELELTLKFGLSELQVECIDKETNRQAITEFNLSED